MNVNVHKLSKHACVQVQECAAPQFFDPVGHITVARWRRLRLADTPMGSLFVGFSAEMSHCDWSFRYEYSVQFTIARRSQFRLLAVLKLSDSRPR